MRARRSASWNGDDMTAGRLASWDGDGMGVWRLAILDDDMRDGCLAIGLWFHVRCAKAPQYGQTHPFVRALSRLVCLWSH